MDFCPHRDARGAARPRGAHPRGPLRPPAPEGARPLRRLVRPAPPGRSSPRRTCSASRCPESAGGLGFGFLDLCMVLREVGRNVVAAARDPDARVGRAADRAVRLRRAAGDPRQGRERRRAAHRRARRDRRRAREAHHHRDARRRRLAHQRHEVERARRDRGRARARARDGRRRRSRCSSCRPSARGHHAPRASRR